MEEREEERMRMGGESDPPSLSQCPFSCLVLSPGSTMVLQHASCAQLEGSHAGCSLCGHRHWYRSRSLSVWAYIFFSSDGLPVI